MGSKSLEPEKMTDQAQVQASRGAHDVRLRAMDGNHGCVRLLGPSVGLYVSHNAGRRGYYVEKECKKAQDIRISIDSCSTSEG